MAFAGCLLDRLEHIRGDPVWGEALASIGIGGWCSDPTVVEEFRLYLAEVAAERMLDEESIQQLQRAFCRPVLNEASKVSSHGMRAMSCLQHFYCVVLSVHL